MPEETKYLITFLQWNCDGLATKVNELEELVQRKSVDIVLMQETKLDLEDVIPRLKCFDCLQKETGREVARLSDAAVALRFTSGKVCTWKPLSRIEHQLNFKPSKSR